MVADFGFTHRGNNNVEPVVWSSVTEPDAPESPHGVRVARILAAKAAIDAGRYELDDQIAEGVAEAVLDDMA